MSGAKQRLNGTRRAVPGSKGWSDADAIKALDKRARLDSPDGSLTTWQDQGGMHAQVTNTAPTITYDAATEKFTVTIPSFICQETDDQFARDYTNDAPEDDPLTGKAALIAYSPLIFNKHSDDYTVELVLDHHAGPDVAAYAHTQVWQASVATATACTDFGSLLFQSKHGYQCGLSRRLWSMTLKADGTYTLDYTSGKLDFAGPARSNPHSFMSYDPGDPGDLRLHNLMTRYNDAFATANELGLEIPVSSASEIHLGKDSATGTLAMDLQTGSVVFEGYVHRLGYIETDSDGMCTEFQDYSGFSQHPLYGLTQAVTITQDPGPNITLTFTSGILTAVT